MPCVNHHFFAFLSSLQHSYLQAGLQDFKDFNGKVLGEHVIAGLSASLTRQAPLKA